MNFLAHTYLSCSNENLLVGNVLADFANNKEIGLFPKEYLLGVELHRKIDTFTDAHPAVLEVNKHFHEKHHKYAPVVTDILFDLVLANHWQRFSEETLEAFTENIYKILLKNEAHFPERRKKSILTMINGNFLMNYTNLEGLAYTFSMMDKRTKFKSNFLHVLDNIDDTYPFLEAAFLEFFPALMEEVHGYCDC